MRYFLIFSCCTFLESKIQSPKVRKGEFGDLYCDALCHVILSILAIGLNQHYPTNRCISNSPGLPNRTTAINNDTSYPSRKCFSRDGTAAFGEDDGVDAVDVIPISLVIFIVPHNERFNFYKYAAKAPRNVLIVAFIPRNWIDWGY
jgi:hypothetical protein